VQTASRSIALTADPRLQARNWRVIAQARERQGKLAEARSAAARATALEGATAPAPFPPGGTRTR
jgi:predicted Zn-dependent protease